MPIVLHCKGLREQIENVTLILRFLSVLAVQYVLNYHIRRSTVLLQYVLHRDLFTPERAFLWCASVY